MRLFRSCAMVLLLALAVFACNREKIALFEDYYYGMPWAEVRQRPGVEPCPGDDNALCRKNPAIFFKMYWAQRFLFKNDKLTAVELSRPDPKAVSALVDAWLDGGQRYMPVFVASAGRRFDVLDGLRRLGREQTRAAMKRFAQSTASDPQTVYLYLDFTEQMKLLNSAASYEDVLSRAPRSMPGIEESLSDKRIGITFLAPVAEWQDAGGGERRSR